MKSLNFALMLGLVLPALASASTLEERLREFDQNPKKFMNTLPEKGRENAVSLFSIPEIRSREFVRAKNENRQVLSGRASIKENDRPEDLVDNGSRLLRTLEEMEEKNLTAAELQTKPWSDYYWALYEGQLAYRYADSEFPGSEDWKDNADFIRSTFDSPEANSSSLANLSPAEKYDLLVGDSEKTLTKQSLATGQEYYDAKGVVETWMGICHGWAPASYMFDRPKNSINVVAADGVTVIPFRPTDIKALASLLWAQNSNDVNFVGGRCNEAEPEEDSNGRVTDRNCFDTNPGTWHMAVVNQVGLSKRSMVMDAVYDYEVWNHPVYAYSYTYFNPQTMKEKNSIDKAKVAIEDFSKDKFKKYRSKKAAYVVGVSMEVQYTVETQPTTAAKDTPDSDATNSVTYEYDLELDADGKIIGGEWYRNAHPDFLWTPRPDGRALSAGDEMLLRRGNPRWDPSKEGIPAEWQRVAQRTSAAGSPLALVVEALVKMSNSRLAL